MLLLKRKVFAYITHGDRLLILRHPRSPAAGLQVPAGTVEQDEDLAQAVLREAGEETGLRQLRLVFYLGEQLFDLAPFGRDELHQRFFFHLACDGDVPEVWQHVEQQASDGSGPHLFELFWARMPHQVPALIADHDKFLPLLFERLG